MLKDERLFDQGTVRDQWRRKTLVESFRRDSNLSEPCATIIFVVHQQTEISYIGVIIGNKSELNLRLTAEQNLVTNIPQSLYVCSTPFSVISCGDVNGRTQQSLLIN